MVKYSVLLIVIGYLEKKCPLSESRLFSFFSWPTKL